MKHSIAAPMSLIAFVALASTGTTLAHHSFAHFDTSKQTLIEGTVNGWSYSSPHSWLYIDAPDTSGQMQKWSFEAAGPIRVARQGVTGNTYRKGDKVRVVMSPIRDGRAAGGICFVVKSDGSVTYPYDGACEAPEVFARWKAKGWIDNSKHLDSHPFAD